MWRNNFETQRYEGDIVSISVIPIDPSLWLLYRLFISKLASPYPNFGYRYETVSSVKDKEKHQSDDVLSSSEDEGPDVSEITKVETLPISLGIPIGGLKKQVGWARKCDFLIIGCRKFLLSEFIYVLVKTLGIHSKYNRNQKV